MGYQSVQWHSSPTYLATSPSVPPYVREGSGGVGGALVGHCQCQCGVGALLYDLGSWCRVRKHLQIPTTTKKVLLFHPYLNLRQHRID